MSESCRERNLDYDFLRFVAISCIVLAHIGVPPALFQIRNFDVPLMVLLSGMSFAAFSSGHFKGYGEYLFRRFIRIVLPAWVMLLFLNSIFFVFKGTVPTSIEILKELTLIGGDVDVGVWVLRVFFLMSALAPFLFKLNARIQSNTAFYFSITMAWVVYESAFGFLSATIDKKVFDFVDIMLLQTFAYGCIFVLGIRVLKLEKGHLLKLTAFFFVSFLLVMGWLFMNENDFVQTQLYKYPPRLYYVLYAMLASLSLVYATKYTNIFNRIKRNGVVRFIGKSTLWIYLWRWFVLRVLGYMSVDMNVYVEFVFVLSLATSIAYIQFRCVHIAMNFFEISSGKKRLLRTVFTG